MNTIKTISLTMFVLVALGTILILAANCGAQNYIVLDGFGGVFNHAMQPEATRLQQSGHDVIYRPWWRWRSAVHAVNGPVNIIGYSLGGSRANVVARRTDVQRLEMIDPFTYRQRPIFVPANISAVVYRASGRTLVRSTPVQGHLFEFRIPTNHVGMPESYFSSPLNFHGRYQ